MMFVVEQMIGTVNNQRYPYKWRVGYDPWYIPATTHDEMLNWVGESGLPHVLTGSAIYFKTKEDVSVFLLRWA